MPGFSLRKATRQRYDDVLARIPELLAAEGFGVLTRIDVHDALKKKIGVDFRRTAILGACNPKLAHKALSAEMGIALLLPCNVVVFDDAGKTVVQVVKPEAMFSVVRVQGLEPLAAEADERLQRALRAI